MEKALAADGEDAQVDDPVSVSYPLLRNYICDAALPGGRKPATLPVDLAPCCHMAALRTHACMGRVHRFIAPVAQARSLRHRCRVASQGF